MHVRRVVVNCAIMAALLVSNLAVMAVPVAQAAVPSGIASGSGTTSAKGGVGSRDELSATGAPAPGIGFYYGGAPIVFVDINSDYAANETVQVYLGTPITGTLLVTNAVASSTGTLKATVPVPQVPPGVYLFSTLGLQSGHVGTGHATIVPYLKPDVTAGPAGTEVNAIGQRLRAK